MSNAKVNFDLPTGIENLDVTVNFTSKIYPVVVIDATTVTGTLDSALLWNGIIEATQPLGLLTEFSLRPILLDTTVEPEATTVSGSLTAVTLDTILVRTTVEPEATTVAGSLTAFTLDSKLVATTMEPEATTVSGSLTGLQLN